MRRSHALAACLILAAACTPVTDSSPGALSLGVGTSPTVVTSPLVPVGSDPNGDGFVDLKARARGTEIEAQSLHLQVNRLDGRTAFQLVVDGTIVDAFTTTPGGAFEAVYEPNPKGSHRLLPEAVTPVTNIRLVEIKNAGTGEIVLRAELGDQEPPEPECEFALVATGADPDAVGGAEIEVETEPDGAIRDQTFQIKVENLSASTLFNIFVDGAQIGAFVTDADGRATVTFSSSPETGESPFPSTVSDLRQIKLIEIRDASGAVVLTGSNPC